MDNQAYILAAQDLISVQSELPNFLAHNLASLYSSLFHGVTTPYEALSYYTKNQLNHINRENQRFRHSYLFTKRKIQTFI